MAFKYLCVNGNQSCQVCKILDDPVDNILFKDVLFWVMFPDGTKKQVGLWDIRVIPCTEEPTHRFLHGSMCGSFYEECNILEHLSNGKIRVVFFDGLVDEWSYQDVDPEDLIELKKINNQDAFFKSIS